jgi:polysaccharide export outer membrane protein
MRTLKIFISIKTIIFLLLIALLQSLSLFTPVYSKPEEMDYKQGYTLGSGDIVRITVLDEPDLSGPFQVSSLERISYPFLGNINVKGMTVEDLNLYLTMKLMEDYLVNPIVTVSVESYKSKKVFIQGEVAQPGVYYLKEKSGVLNLLLESGGTTKDASEEIVILRSTGNSEDGESENFEHIKINLRDLLGGDQKQNIPVQNGDIIFIANASGGQFRTEGRFVNIMGEVKKPGNYDYRLGLTVLNAILEAGGFTEYAAKNKVRVIKKIGDSQKVVISKLDDLVKRGKFEEDVLLEPGDLVVVPQSLF